MKTCSYCGCENDDAIVACRECGTELRSIERAQASPVLRPHTVRIIGLVAAILGAGAVAFAPALILLAILYLPIYLPLVLSFFIRRNEWRGMRWCLRMAPFAALCISFAGMSGRPDFGDDVGGNIAGATYNFGWTWGSGVACALLAVVVGLMLRVLAADAQEFMRCMTNETTGTRWILGLALVVCMELGCQRKQAFDARAVLLAAAQKADAHFPDGKASKLTKFALLGSVVTSAGVLQVVEMRLVLSGMPAPRGQQYLVFFAANGNWLGKQPCRSTPLWCEGSKVFLFGLEEFEGAEGNAWNLQSGFEGRTLVRQAEYGSYLPPDSQP